jgi:hypothetical protein
MFLVADYDQRIIFFVENNRIRGCYGRVESVIATSEDS